MSILMKIPETLINQVNSGAAQVVGATVRDAVTQKILGHLQQTTGLESLLSAGMQGTLNTISGGFAPLDMVNAVQNQQMLKKLSSLQESMGLLQNLQFGNLALSGAGLGVSVVGFAMVLKRLKSIQVSLDEIDQKIEQVTSERRKDDLASLFAKIEADVNGVGYLTAHPNPAGAAEAHYQHLMRYARDIENYLNRETEFMHDGKLTIEQLERMWSLVALLRVCQETAIQALFHADLLEVASKLANDEAQRFALRLSQIVPDSLARIIANQEPEWDKSIALRKSAFAQATTLASGVIEGTVALAGQSSLANTLLETQQSGRALLLEAEAEQDSPMLFLSSNP